MRWWQRGGRKNPKVEEAWGEAIEVELPNKDYDEARLHRQTGTVILRQGVGGGTVIDSTDLIVERGGMSLCGCCLSQIDGNGRCPNPECKAQ